MISSSSSSSSTETLIGGRLQGLSGRSTTAVSHPSSGIKYGELGGVFAFDRVRVIASSLKSLRSISMDVATGVANETLRGALWCVVLGCDNRIVCTGYCANVAVLFGCAGNTRVFGTKFVTPLQSRAPRPREAHSEN